MEISSAGVSMVVYGNSWMLHIVWEREFQIIGPATEKNVAAVHKGVNFVNGVGIVGVGGSMLWSMVDRLDSELICWHTGAVFVASVWILPLLLLPPPWSVLLEQSRTRTPCNVDISADITSVTASADQQGSWQEDDVSTVTEDDNVASKSDELSVDCLAADLLSTWQSLKVSVSYCLYFVCMCVCVYI